MLWPPASETEEAIYKAVLASTKRNYTKRVSVFTPPALTITEEELGAKIEEILDRVTTNYGFFFARRTYCVWNRSHAKAPRACTSPHH